MPDKSVFVSYAREDVEAFKRLKERYGSKRLEFILKQGSEGDKQTQAYKTFPQQIKLGVTGSMIIIPLFLLALSAGAEASELFHETFDSLQDIQANAGTLNPVQSSFEQGLSGNALHVRGSEIVSYGFPEIEDISEGSIDFYFKPHRIGESYGLVNLEAASRIFSFINYDRAWIELGTGGFRQHTSDQMVAPERWHHVAIVWRCKPFSGSYKIYLDGLLGHEYGWRGSCRGMDFTGPVLFEVGMSFYYGWGETTFDDLRIYDHALLNWEIRARAKMVESDPDRDRIELIGPENGAEIPGSGSIDDEGFSWVVPPGWYIFELSTEPSFPRIGTLRFQRIFQRSSGSILVKKKISLEEIARLVRRAKYAGDTFYCRVSVRKGSDIRYSETRSFNIVFANPEPAIRLDDGEEIEREDYIGLDFGSALKVRVEVAEEGDFSGRVTRLTPYIAKDSFWGDYLRVRLYFGWLKLLARRDPDGVLYMRLRGPDIHGNEVFSEPVGFRVSGA